MYKTENLSILESRICILLCTCTHHVLNTANRTVQLYYDTALTCTRHAVDTVHSRIVLRRFKVWRKVDFKILRGLHPLGDSGKVKGRYTAIIVKMNRFLFSTTLLVLSCLKSRLGL